MAAGRRSLWEKGVAFEKAASKGLGQIIHSFAGLGQQGLQLADQTSLLQLGSGSGGGSGALDRRPWHGVAVPAGSCRFALPARESREPPRDIQPVGPATNRAAPGEGISRQPPQA